MACCQKCVGVLLIALGLLLIAVQVWAALFYWPFPVEWTLSGFWGGLLVAITGLLALFDRPSVHLMAMITIFTGLVVLLVHAAGAVIIHVLTQYSTWNHSRYLRHVDDLYLMLLWARAGLGLLVVIADSILLCQVERSRIFGLSRRKANYYADY